MNIRQLQAVRKSIMRLSSRLDDLKSRRVLQDPMVYIESKRAELDFVQGKLIAAAEKLNSANRHRFVALASSLDAMSPLKVLSRGYTIATNNGSVVRSVNDADKGDRLSLRVTDGVINCTVEESEALSHE